MSSVLSSLGSTGIQELVARYHYNSSPKENEKIIDKDNRSLPLSKKLVPSTDDSLFFELGPDFETKEDTFRVVAVEEEIIEPSTSSDSQCKFHIEFLWY